jgi:hypothetical protein
LEVLVLALAVDLPVLTMALREPVEVDLVGQVELVDF